MGNGMTCGFTLVDSQVSKAKPGAPDFLHGVLPLSRGQLLGSFCRSHYRFDERDTKAALFEFENSVDSAAGGSGDGVFEQGGMISSFEDHFCGAEGGLRGELGCSIARQADLYSSFGEGLNDDVDVCGAGGGEAGDGVHVLFVDDDGAAYGLENALRQFHLLRGDEASAAKACGSGAES